LNLWHLRFFLALYWWTVNNLRWQRLNRK
jgi:hypothetical protein